MIGKRMVKVLAINASPRKYGNSYKLLRVAVEASKFAGASVDMLHLYDYSIEPCLGCVSDEQLICRYPCLIDTDDGNKVLNKIVDSDAIIVSTPIYWYGPSGLLKNLVDRMTSLENMIFISGKSLLEGRVVGFIAVGADSGNIAAISYLMVVMNSMGALIPPWALAYYLGQGDALQNKESVLDAANLGFLVTKAAQGYHPRDLKYNPLLIEELGGQELINKIAAETNSLYSLEQLKRKSLFQSHLREKPSRDR
ncbi:MAG: flavodoxin family protein [Sulfolobales archaeon]